MKKERKAYVSPDFSCQDVKIEKAFLAGVTASGSVSPWEDGGEEELIGEEYGLDEGPTF